MNIRKMKKKEVRAIDEECGVTNEFETCKLPTVAKDCSKCSCIPVLLGQA